MNLTLSPKAWRWLRRLGIPVFYLVSLVVCVRCTFPYGRVATRIVATYNAAEAQKSGRRLEIGSMGGYWLFGVRAHDVRFIGPLPPPDDEGKIHPATVTQIDRLHLSVSPWRLMGAPLRVHFGATADEGSVHGSFVDGKDERDVEVTLAQMGVQSIPLLSDLIGIPMSGLAVGEAKLEFPEKRLSLTEGNLEITIEDLEIGDGKTKIQGFVALPKLRAGQLVLQADVQEGRVRIEKLAAKGPDLELEASGQLRLRDKYEQSMVDLNLRYKFSEEYQTKNDITKGFFGVLDFDPKVKRAKGEDGSYSWRVTGTFKKLSFQPGQRPATSRRSRAARP